LRWWSFRGRGLELGWSGCCFVQVSIASMKCSSRAHVLRVLNDKRLHLLFGEPSWWSLDESSQLLLGIDILCRV
jgi:hypothetical protein